MSSSAGFPHLFALYPACTYLYPRFTEYSVFPPSGLCILFFLNRLQAATWQSLDPSLLTLNNSGNNLRSSDRSVLSSVSSTAIPSFLLRFGKEAVHRKICMHCVTIHYKLTINYLIPKSSLKVTNIFSFVFVSTWRNPYQRRHRRVYMLFQIPTVSQYHGSITMWAITWTPLFSKVTGRFMIFLWGKILLVYDYNVYVLNHTEHMKYFVFEFWLIIQINDGSQMVWFQDAFVVGVCYLDAGCRLMATVFHLRDSQQLLSPLILWPWTWVVMIAANSCALSHEEELFLNDDTCGFLIDTVKGLKTSTMSLSGWCRLQVTDEVLGVTWISVCNTSRAHSFITHTSFLTPS